jgi:hypothetical protein
MRMEGAKERTVIKRRSCRVTDTSCGLSAVPTSIPILGKGITVLCCALAWQTKVNRKKMRRYFFI